MNQYLLRIEAANFDYSVYDTHDISTIRGGSFMLLDAFDRLKAELKTKRLVRDIGSSASIGLFAFEAENDQAAQAIKAQILNEPSLKELHDLKFATLLTEVMPVEPKQSFQENLHSLAAKVRWQQYKTAAMCLPQETDREEACKLDGVRPAVQDDRQGDQVIKVSSAVYARRDRGKGLRQKFYEELLGAKEFSTGKYAFTNDLEALASDPNRGNLHSKIAFIHLDGNRFGRTRDAKCVKETLLLDFQNHIQERLRKPALRSLIQFAIAPGNESFKYNNPKTQKPEIRLETPLWGGDEMEWVVPAWQALNVLEVFFKAASQAENWEGIRLTHAAGVVFCHHNLPILQVRRYARQLCDLAKKGLPTAVDQITADANRVAFLNLSAFDLIGSEVKEFLKAYNQPAQPEDFVVHDAASALPLWQKHLLVLKKHFPRNKIHALLRALKERKEQEVKDILERVEKLMNEKIWRETVAPAIAYLTQDHQNFNRWFLIADLINYVGEDR